MAFVATLLGTLLLAGLIGYVLTALIVPDDDDYFL